MILPPITMLYYCILAHKNPKQLELLSKQLTHKNTRIFVHLDGYTDIRPFLYLKDQVHFVQKRVKVRRWWFSMVEATLNTFEEMLPFLKSEDHVIIMSGQDFPIKSNEKILEFFRNYQGKSFIEYREQPNKEWNILNRVVKYHFHDLVIPEWINWIFHSLASKFYDVSKLRNQIFCYIAQRFVNFFLPLKRYLIKNYTIYRGSQWQALAMPHIKYLVDFKKTDKGKKTIKEFKTTAGPDEIYIQTILLNSKYANDIINDMLWYIDWKKGPGLPRILDISDLEEIKDSDRLFARKFDLDIDKNLLYNLSSNNAL